MKTLDFFELSRPVQDRFLHSTRGGTPLPLAFVPHVDHRWRFGILAALAGIAAACIVAFLGLGQLESPHALQPPWFIALYAGLFLVAGLGGIVARVGSRRLALLPYPAGVYLFPSGVLDARSARLRFYGLEELKAAHAPQSVLRLSFEGAAFDFSVGSADSAQGLLATVERLKPDYEAALSGFNHRELAGFDPLRDTGFSSPFSPKTALQRPTQRGFVAVALPVSVVLSGALGAGLLLGRNQWSEARLFAAARAQDSVSAYRAYLLRGGSSEEISEVLLPRAELALARAERSVRAIEAFQRTHPNSKIAAEVEEALRAALLAELATEAGRGSLTSLRQFEARHARHRELYDAEYQRAVEAHFEGILSAYRTSPRFSEKTASFVTALVRFAHTFGGVAEVRFRRVLRESLLTADRQVQKSTYYTGAEALPSRYFDAAHSHPREARVARELVSSWQPIFPEDVLKFEQGQPSLEPEGTPPVFTVPTLLIEYVVGGAGVYPSRKPRGVFVGIGVVFNAVFVIPDSAERLTFKASSWKVPDASALAEGQGSVKEVYEAVAQESFERFLKLYHAEYFAEVPRPAAGR